MTFLNGLDMSFEFSSFTFRAKGTIQYSFCDLTDFKLFTCFCMQFAYFNAKQNVLLEVWTCGKWITECLAEPFDVDCFLHALVVFYSNFCWLNKPVIVQSTNFFYKFSVFFWKSSIIFGSNSGTWIGITRLFCCASFVLLKRNFMHVIRPFFVETHFLLSIEWFPSIQFPS